ncbi:NAD(P)H-hydrate dehydratase, partial [bacterium]|nr:NAD(P)H-hydrate dehydratase [bacterium]
MKVSLTSEMRDLDRRAVEEYGLVEDLLMENAGLAAYSVILEQIGIAGKSFVVFCGGGNNGGDGLVVARKLHSNDGEVTVYLLSDASKFKGAAARNFEIAQKVSFKMIQLKEVGAAAAAIDQADAIVDALFGTGLSRDVGGIYSELIDLINSSQKPVFSLDIPSGVNGDSGQVMGTAVKAADTITFGLPKVGNLLYPGFECGGRLHVTHISFPRELHNSDELKIRTNDLLPVPPRASDGHKGSFGKVLFIAGAANYLGAPYFSAMAFLKAGGGLSYLATPEAVASFVGNKGSEIVFLPQRATSTGSIALENKSELLKFSKNVDMVVLGPGLSLNDATQELVRTLTAEIEKPMVIDGDGLTAVASDLSCVQSRSQPTLLTPHLGEMGRLVGQSPDEIQSNRIACLQETAQKLSATLVLKGAHSLVGMPDQRVFINLSGNSGMATAGSGDVLVGTISAMFGLGFDMEEATRMGVFVHGFAGD